MRMVVPVTLWQLQISRQLQVFFIWFLFIRFVALCCNRQTVNITESMESLSKNYVKHEKKAVKYYCLSSQCLTDRQRQLEQKRQQKLDMRERKIELIQTTCQKRPSSSANNKNITKSQISNDQSSMQKKTQFRQSD